MIYLEIITNGKKTYIALSDATLAKSMVGKAVSIVSAEVALTGSK